MDPNLTTFLMSKEFCIKCQLVLAVILAIQTSPVKSQQNGAPIFKKSQKTTHTIPEGQQYTFGYLEVPENRNNPNGTTIEIPVYIFKSRSPNPKPDPIIYTVGGPGSTTMPSAQYMNYYKYLDDRDFILIEQRGNYYAKPHLDCPEWSHAVYRSNLPDFDSTSSDSLFISAAQACRQRLTDAGIDLNAYNTNEIAADIADLTRVLNIEQYNLLTISYSTKIAQVLLRDYPQRIRSVVMDSPLPLEANYDQESVGNLLTAVATLLSDCKSDPNCNKAYPDLKQRFLQYLREKTQKPLQVVIENPQNGKSEIFKLKGADLITVFTSASTGDVSELPFEINKLLTNDQSTLIAELTQLFEEPNGGSGIGMRLSVWCAEEFPFTDQKVVATETLRYPEVAGLSPTVYDAEICDVWKVTQVPEIENHAVKSDIPVLLISGEYDNETPVKWALAMKKNLSNSHHLTFKGWKHTPTTNWGNQCAMIAANAFFNNPDRVPNPGCFQEIKTPVFKIPQS
jgi:pimeloyl-ACP methyl ester carboxylesterase